MKNLIAKQCAFQLLVLISTISSAQPVKQLTLAECYQWANENYPMSQQYDLIEKAAEYKVENIAKGYLPQLSVKGQATYQSEVTRIPVEMPGVTVLSKDQYKAYAELDQLIYDGGMTKNQKELERGNEQVEELKLETELYKLHEQINQLFFGVLLIDAQLKQNELLQQDIQTGIRKVEAAVKNGTALKSELLVLKANLLKTKQQNIELQSARKAYTKMLSLFIGKEIAEETDFVKPSPIQSFEQITRPELYLYDQQMQNLEVRNQVLDSKALPKLSFFVQGGIGRPALNFLSNDFEPYYLGGLRLSWTPSIFYTLKNERELLDVNRQTLALQKETFLFNTYMETTQQSSEIDKYQKLLDTDNEIIAMREEVKEIALAKLNNGVIDANDYLQEVTAEDQARQSKILHEIHLLMTQYERKTTVGITKQGNDE